MPKGYHHVTRDERSQIAVLKATGFLSLRGIASKLQLCVSTVSRELRRNETQGKYRFIVAHHQAQIRRTQASSKPKKLTTEVMTQVEEKLKLDWSPEQIAGRMKQEGTHFMSHESIYRYVWRDKQAGGALYKHLRHHGKRYNKRGGKKAGRGHIPQRVDISERPAIVEQKIRIGDWEGDTIIGAMRQQAIVTHVDRHSKYALLKKVIQKTAENVRAATIEKMRHLPHLIHSITYDNGMEFASHQETAKALKTQCYFATPYHSWERGLNEHTNGLVRQYLKKGSDFSGVTDEHLQVIEDRLNHRPRKVLNYKTPFEVFFGNTSNPSVALQC